MTKKNSNDAPSVDETTGVGSPELVGQPPHPKPGQTENDRATRGFMKQMKSPETQKPKRSKLQPSETQTPEQDKKRQGVATTQTSPDERARKNKENQGK